MEVQKNNPSVSGVSVGQPRAKPMSYSTLDVIGAAFSSENGVISAVQGLNFIPFKPDENFNVFEAAAQSPYYENHAGELGVARSQAEFDTISQRIATEYRRRQILMASGAGGTIAGIAASLLDPTMFIPAYGQAAKLRGAAQIVGLSAGAAVLHEGMLQSSQLTRTAEESALSIGLGTFLGASLGGAAKYLSTRGARRVASGMDVKRGEMTILQTDADGALKEADFDTSRVVNEQNADGSITERVEDVPAGEHRVNEVEEVEDVLGPVPQEIISYPRGLTRKKVPDFDTEMAYGKKPLIARVREGVNAVFTKNRGVTAEYTEGGYTVSLVDDNFKELPGWTPSERSLGGWKGYNAKRSGNLVIFSEKELKEALARGEIDEYIDELLIPVDRAKAPAPTPDAPASTNVDGPSTAGAQQTAKNTVTGLKRSGVSRGRGQKVIDYVNSLEARGRPMKVVKGLLRQTARAVIDPVGALARLNPVTRTLDNAYSSAARTWMGKLHTAGLRLDTGEGGVVADAGTVYDRARVGQRYIADAIVELDKGYLRYLTGKDVDVSHFSAQIAVIKSNVGMVPAGKMTYAEFGETVFRLGNTGQKSGDAGIDAAVKAQRAYYDKMHEIAKRYYEEAKAMYGEYDAEVNPGGIRPLYDELEFPEDGDIQAYVHHMFDQEYLRGNFEEFSRVFSEHIAGKMQEEFAGSFKAFTKVKDKLEKTIRIHSLNEEELSTQLGALEAEARVLKDQLGPSMKAISNYRATLKDAGLSPEEVLEGTKAFEKTLATDDYLKAKARLSELSKDISIAKKAGAGLTEKQAEILAKAEKLEDLQLDAIDNVIDEAVRVQKKLARLDKLDAREVEALKKLRDRLLRTDKELRDQYDKLMSGWYGRGLEDIPAWKKYEGTIEKQKDLLNQVRDFKYLDLDEARESLDNALLAYKQKKRALIANRVRRQDELVEKAKAADPNVRAQYRQDELLQAQKSLDELTTGFNERWVERGIDDLDMQTGKADFTAKAKEDARELYLRLVGQPFRTSGLAVLGGERGAQLSRFLNIPFEEKAKFLVRDPEKVLRSHAHHMLPDMELYRATGSVNGARIIAEVEDDFKAQLDAIPSYTHMLKGKPVNQARLTPGELEAARPITELDKEILTREINDARKEILEDTKVVIDRLRHARGLPQNPDGFMYRAGRVVQNLTIVTKLGTVVPSSMGDITRAVALKGVSSVWKTQWAPLVSDFKRISMSSREAYMAGIGLDPLLHNRPQALFDIGENYSTRQSLAERGLEFAANKTGFIALFDRWTQMSKTMATSTSITEVTDAIRRVAGQVESTPKELTAARELLNYANLGDESVRRIVRQLDLPGGSTEFKHGVKLPNTEVWDDPDAIMAYRTALNKIADDLVITTGPDRPSWMDQNAAFRLLAMLRGFSFTATNRILMAGLQQPDMVFMQSAIMALATGALSYYTWAITSGGQNWENAKRAEWDQVIYEAVGRSGLLGALSEGQRLGEKIPALNDYEAFGGGRWNSRSSEGLVSGLVGPAYGTFKGLLDVVQGADDPTQATVKAARTSLVPYQNVFYMKWAFDALESGLNNALNIPVRRNAE